MTNWVTTGSLAGASWCTSAHHVERDRERRDDDDQLPCSARPGLPNRSEILAHSTQTSCGITPAFINT